MSTKTIMLLFWLFSGLLSVCCAAAVATIDIDCQQPPQLVDPTLCCQDGGREQAADLCAKRMGITEQNLNVPPNIETATCIAECILNESRYMQTVEQMHFDTIRADLQHRFANDSLYVETMISAYQKCQPSVQQRVQAFRQTPLAAQHLQRHGCNPFASMMLGCVYMEYFGNCPAHRWTVNADCALAKQFVTQCVLSTQ